MDWVSPASDDGREGSSFSGSASNEWAGEEEGGRCGNGVEGRIGDMVREPRRERHARRGRFRLGGGWQRTREGGRARVKGQVWVLVGRLVDWLWVTVCSRGVIGWTTTGGARQVSSTSSQMCPPPRPRCDQHSSTKSAFSQSERFLYSNGQTRERIAEGREEEAVNTGSPSPGVHETVMDDQVPPSCMVFRGRGQ